MEKNDDDNDDSDDSHNMDESEETMTMQVQYSERDSDHGSNGVARGGGVVANNGVGVGLGSRERLAPPSSSSESLGGDLKSTYYTFLG